MLTRVQFFVEDEVSKFVAAFSKMDVPAGSMIPPLPAHAVTVEQDYRGSVILLTMKPSPDLIRWMATMQEIGMFSRDEIENRSGREPIEVT